MLHASFDPKLGARLLLVATLLLAGCSGDDESDTSRVDEGGTAAADVSSASERQGDGGTQVVDASVDASSPLGSEAGRPDGPSTPSETSTGITDVAVDVPELALCLRLKDPQNTNHILLLSQAVGDKYLVSLNADCRIATALHPPGGTQALVKWRNDLYSYSLDLWKCTTKPLEGFALVSTAFTDITSADAALMIQLYLDAAKDILQLTPDELASMRRDLERMAQSAVARESTQYTMTNCADAGRDADAQPPVDAGADRSEAASDASAKGDAADSMADAGDVGVDSASESIDAAGDSMDAEPDSAEAGPDDAGLSDGATDEGGD